MSLENSKSEKTGKQRNWGKSGELHQERPAKVVRGPDEYLSLRNDENIVLNSILGPSAKHIDVG